MDNLTKEQKRKLAKQLVELSKTLDAFANKPDVPGDAASNLRAAASKLRNQADQLTDEAMMLAMDEIDKSLASIVEATDGMAKAVAKINKVTSYADYAEKVVLLAGAIMTGNAATIASTVAGILGSLREDGVI